MRRRYVAALADVVRQEQGSRRYSERIRRSALEELSVIADPDDDEALQTILAAMADANWEIRQYAAWALGQLANPRAVDALTEALNDASPYVCFVAADALQRLRSSRVRAAPGAFRYTES